MRLPQRACHFMQQRRLPRMSAGLVAHCAELLALLGSVRTRRMFGGHGFWVDGLFIALITSERLHLKTNDDTVAKFAAAGCAQFVYMSQGKPQHLNYWTAPDEAMDSPEAMHPWARLAMQAAVAARMAKPDAASSANKRKTRAKSQAKAQAN